MVSVESRTRRHRDRVRSVVRRRIEPETTDFLPGPEPLEPEPAQPRDDRPAPTRKGKRQSTVDKPAREPRDVWIVRLLVVVLAGALVAAGLLGRQWYDARQTGAARTAALAAARQETTNFVSISASTVDGDLQRIADGATGEFKDEFTRDMPQVRAAVVSNKVTSAGTVLRAAVVSSDRRSAVVLLAVDANVKNAGAPDGRVSHYRIQVSLARDPGSGRWLVSQLQFVG